MSELRTVLDLDGEFFIVEESSNHGMSWQGVEIFQYRQDAEEFIASVRSARAMTEYVVITALRQMVAKINHRPIS